MSKDGPDCKTRFDRLFKAYSTNKLAAMRRSGTDEEFGECEQLLEDISSQIEGYKTAKEADAAFTVAKKDGIEKSGVIMRQLAMEALSDEDEDDNEDGSPPASKRRRISGLFDTISTSVADMSREDPTISTFTNFLQQRLAKEDEREIQRQRHEEEREQRQHDRDLASDRMTQEFLLNIMRVSRGIQEN